MGISVFSGKFPIGRNWFICYNSSNQETDDKNGTQKPE